MLSTAQSKHIRSLSQKKFRDSHKQFIAEGDKVAVEWLRSTHRIDLVVATESWAADNELLIQQHTEAEVYIVKERVLETLSALNTANGVLLVLPYLPALEIPLTNDEWFLALDDIGDPGNMGTIIRIADWYGIRNVICSLNCVDIYNPKVVQSAMGGHTRVNIYKQDLSIVLPLISLPKFAATLNGESVYNFEKKSSGVLIIGNESRGISAEIVGLADNRVTIPRLGGAESLNAGVSTGILCALLVSG